MVAQIPVLLLIAAEKQEKSCLDFQMLTSHEGTDADWFRRGCGPQRRFTKRAENGSCITVICVVRERAECVSLLLLPKR